MEQLITAAIREYMESTPSDQSNSRRLDQIEVAPSRRATAVDFGRTIGSLDLDTLREHQLAVAMAVIELAADAQHPFPWSHDDPTVALVRAAAKIALTAPDSTSSAAADLIERLLDAG